MKKVLFTANVVKAHINAFHIPYLKMLKEAGCEVHVAAKNDYENEKCDIPYCNRFWEVPFSKNPLSRKNLAIIKQLKELILREKYDIVHCHTPIAAVLTRIAAAQARKKHGTKVMYTAHGFHFYKGAPKKNWLLYYPVEWLCSYMTDCLITINSEDYARAQKKFKTDVEKISGIGVNMERFFPLAETEKQAAKERNGYGGKFVLVYTARFVPGKNHSLFVQCAKELKHTCPNLKIVFVGDGTLFAQMQEMAQAADVCDVIDFLGFRADVPEILKMADVVISASVEEGLGLNLIEGLATGIPAVASVVRGHKEIVVDGENGFLFDAHSVEDFCKKVERLYQDVGLYKQLSDHARPSVQKFSLKLSLEQMKRIYNRFLDGIIQ